MGSGRRRRVPPLCGFADHHFRLGFSPRIQIRVGPDLDPGNQLASADPRAALPILPWPDVPLRQRQMRTLAAAAGPWRLRRRPAKGAFTVGPLVVRRRLAWQLWVTSW